MADDPQQQRKRKRLLVASIGVATVSFMSLQTGCEDEERMSNVANLLAPPIDTFHDPSLARDAATDARLPLPTSGNLVAPPIQANPKDAAVMDALVVSGNLVAPPPSDAAADAADGASDAAADGAAKDAAADAKIVIPPSGNLMPVPPLGPR